jgi:hypothetical protein
MMISRLILGPIPVTGFLAGRTSAGSLSARDGNKFN